MCCRGDATLPKDKPWAIEQLQNNPGLIAEEVAQLATTSTTWRIVQKVDLAQFYNWGEELRAIADELCADATYGLRGQREEYREKFASKTKEALEIEGQALRVFELLEGRKIERTNVRTKRFAMLPIIVEKQRYRHGGRAPSKSNGDRGDALGRHRQSHQRD